jgi:hypothetical protein
MTSTKGLATIPRTSRARYRPGWHCVTYAFRPPMSAELNPSLEMCQHAHLACQKASAGKVRYRKPRMSTHGVRQCSKRAFTCCRNSASAGDLELQSARLLSTHHHCIFMGCPKHKLHSGMDGTANADVQLRYFSTAQLVMCLIVAHTATQAGFLALCPGTHLHLPTWWQPSGLARPLHGASHLKVQISASLSARLMPGRCRRTRCKISIVNWCSVCTMMYVDYAWQCPLV